MRPTRTPAAVAALVSLVVAAQGADAAGKPAVTVRPGTVINITLPSGPNGQAGPYENSCTAGFLFRGKSLRDPRRSAHYLTTAGHCLFVDQSSTEEVHRDGRGPVVTRTALSPTGTAVPGERLGRTVYAAQTVPVAYPDANLPEFHDLGVIELDRDVVVDPALCFFGGPTGLRRGAIAAPELLRFYGAGNATGFNRETGRVLLPGRSAVASSSAHPNVVVGAFPNSGGDSGSPIIDADGRAVASLSGPYQPRIEVMLPRVESVLGIRLTLLTAPLRAGAGPAGSDPACTPSPVR